MKDDVLLDEEDIAVEEVVAEGQRATEKGDDACCHTLISSGDLCLMACDLCLVLVRFLAPIIRQFVKFWDMPKNKRKY